MKIPVIVAAALAAGACTQTGAGSVPAPAPVAGKCDAALVQDLLGRRADDVAGEAQRRAGARTLRRYVTGSPVTMDYREDRLNIETDAGGAIVRLTCG